MRRTKVLQLDDEVQLSAAGERHLSQQGAQDPDQQQTFQRWRDRRDGEGAAGLLSTARTSARRSPSTRSTFDLYRGATSFTAHVSTTARQRHGFPRATPGPSSPAAPLIQQHPLGHREHPTPPSPACSSSDGSPHRWLRTQQELDLIVTLDRAPAHSLTFLVDEGTMSTFRRSPRSFPRTVSPTPSTRPRDHYFVTPRREKIAKDQLPQVATPSASSIGASPSRPRRAPAPAAFSTLQTTYRRVRAHQHHHHRRRQPVPARSTSRRNARFAVAPSAPRPPSSPTAPRPSRHPVVQSTSSATTTASATGPRPADPAEPRTTTSSLRCRSTRTRIARSPVPWPPLPHPLPDGAPLDQVRPRPPRPLDGPAL